MSISSDVAEAVKTELNLHTFSQAFTAVRTWMPVYKRTEVSGLQVTVAPGPRIRGIKNHANTFKQIQIDIGVQMPVDGTDNTEVDPVTDLLEEIEDFLEMHSLPTYATAGWMSSETVSGAEGGFVPELLYNENIYMGLLRITYRIR